MKKAGFFLIGLLILSIVPLISAQDEVPGLEEVPLASEIQQGQQQYEQYTASQNKSEYLKQEWAALLGKNPLLGPVMKSIDAVFGFFNPFFKIVLGHEYGLSWAFVFALIIWLALFFFLNPITSQLTNNGLIGGAVAFVVASLIGLSGAINGVVTLLTKMISNIWITLLCAVIAVVLVLVAEMFGKSIKKKLKTYKEKSMEEQREQGTQVIKAQAEVSRKGLEELSK